MNPAKLTIIILFCCCSPDINPYPVVNAIPPPTGYRRTTNNDPFSAWLCTIPLKKDRIVHLFNGSPKHSQEAQFAVLDISG
jgi:hypothetical protein